MPANDWHMLVAVVIGIVALFAVVIVLGLRFATINQAKLLRETRARDVLAIRGLGSAPRADVLYGVWETKMAAVVVHVRDGNDTNVASIVHRIRGGSITVGDDRYDMVVTSGWRESGSLVRADDRAATSMPLCKYEVRGWAGGRIARYTLADGRILSIHARWRLPWNTAPLPILQDGHVIGQLFDIGRMTNIGRGLVLPSSIPLPVRLFVLYRAEGARQASSTAR